MTAGIHIVGGDLEALSASVGGVCDGLWGLDVAGAVGGAASAVPGSASSGLVAAAAAGLDGRRTALGDRYRTISGGAQNLAVIHRSNDSAVAAATPEAGAGSAARWARARGLE